MQIAYLMYFEHITQVNLSSFMLTQLQTLTLWHHLPYTIWLKPRSVNVQHPDVLHKCTLLKKIKERLKSTHNWYCHYHSDSSYKTKVIFILHSKRWKKENNGRIAFLDHFPWSAKNNSYSVLCTPKLYQKPCTFQYNPIKCTPSSKVF